MTNKNFEIKSIKKKTICYLSLIIIKLINKLDSKKPAAFVSSKYLILRS